MEQSKTDARQALDYWLTPNSSAYWSSSDDVQRLIKRIGQHLPDSMKGIDAEIGRLIFADRHEAAIDAKAEEIAAYEEAKKRSKKILAARNCNGSSWASVDIAAVWETAESETQTDVGHLSGDMPIGIFYRGKVNGVHAESEAGKSWLACLVVVQEIRARRHVAYIDFEDDAASIVRRLKLLGANREDLVNLFHYRNPTGPLTEADEQELRGLISYGGSLAIFDGMTEAMALDGLKGNDAEDVAAWHAKMTKPFAAALWAVVVLDHVPHEGKRAIGSQHKKSALTGVSYFLEPVNPIGKGVVGRSRLKVEKDRPAWVRSNAISGPTPQHFADLVIDFDGKAMPAANIWPARPAENRGYKSEPPERIRKDVRSFIASSPGASKGAIRRAVTGGNADIDWSLEWLIDRGQVTIKQIGQAKKHYPADPAGTLP